MFTLVVNGRRTQHSVQIRDFLLEVGFRSTSLSCRAFVGVCGGGDAYCGADRVGLSPHCRRLNLIRLARSSSARPSDTRGCDPVWDTQVWGRYSRLCPDAKTSSGQLAAEH